MALLDESGWTLERFNQHAQRFHNPRLHLCVLKEILQFFTLNGGWVKSWDPNTGLVRCLNGGSKTEYLAFAFPKLKNLLSFVIFKPSQMAKLVEQVRMYGYYQVS